MICLLFNIRWISSPKNMVSFYREVGGCLPSKTNYRYSFSLSFWNLSLRSFHLLCASSFLARFEADPAFWFLFLMLPFRLSFDTSFWARLKAIDFDSLCLESWVNNPRIFCIVVALVWYFVLRKVVEDLVRRRQDWEGASTQIGGWLFLQFQELCFSLPLFFFSFDKPVSHGPCDMTFSIDTSLYTQDVKHSNQLKGCF